MSTISYKNPTIVVVNLQKMAEETSNVPYIKMEEELPAGKCWLRGNIRHVKALNVRSLIKDLHSHFDTIILYGSQRMRK